MAAPAWTFGHCLHSAAWGWDDLRLVGRHIRRKNRHLSMATYLPSYLPSHFNMRCAAHWACRNFRLQTLLPARRVQGRLAVHGRVCEHAPRTLRRTGAGAGRDALTGQQPRCLLFLRIHRAAQPVTEHHRHRAWTHLWGWQNSPSGLHTRVASYLYHLPVRLIFACFYRASSGTSPSSQDLLRRHFARQGILLPVACPPTTTFQPRATFAYLSLTFLTYLVLHSTTPCHTAPFSS